IAAPETSSGSSPARKSARASFPPHRSPPVKTSLEDRDAFGNCKGSQVPSPLMGEGQDGGRMAGTIPARRGLSTDAALIGALRKQIHPAVIAMSQLVCHDY